MSTQSIVPYTIGVAESQLVDLRQRLHATRWPDAGTVSDWSQGVPLPYCVDLCRYWADTYDWRARERHLNTFPQFKTAFDGLDIHFLHVRSPETDALPLILTHGWPGSFVEFLDVIGPLTDPVAHGGERADAFHVVVPSIPGYAWSDKPTEVGWGIHRVADIWSELMSRLGYERYGAQGGDWGAGITTLLARADPDHLVGIHLNFVGSNPDPGQTEFSTDEAGALATRAHYMTAEAGYMMQQSTRPQTLGYGLTDSPAGQCAWILEKLSAWTNDVGDPISSFGADRILDNVMMYWLPGTAASSARLYWESAQAMQAGLGEVTVPTGASIAANEIMKSTRDWAARQYLDLRYWQDVPVGGHFAAFEQPVLFVNEVRNFFRLMK